MVVERLELAMIMRKLSPHNTELIILKKTSILPQGPAGHKSFLLRQTSEANTITTVSLHLAGSGTHPGLMVHIEEVAKDTPPLPPPPPPCLVVIAW